jgi:uncharacterized membrane protein YphA (DoxX/SURF4 family)
MPVKYWNVQRLFSMFPDSYCGRALIMFRVSAAGTFVMLSIHRGIPPAFSLVILIQLLLTVALILGFMTPIVSAVCCCWELSTLFGYPEIDKLSTIFAAMSVAALGFLGPGAFSLDARLYGRRVIRIPFEPANRSSRLDR